VLLHDQKRALRDMKPATHAGCSILPLLLIQFLMLPLPYLIQKSPELPREQQL